MRDDGWRGLVERRASLNASATHAIGASSNDDARARCVGTRADALA